MPKHNENNKTNVSGCYATPLQLFLIKLNEPESEVKMNLMVIMEGH